MNGIAKAAVVSAVLLLASAEGGFHIIHAEEPVFSDPVKVEDEDAPGGAWTTWNCVYFGSYPSCEVTKQEFTSVEPYAVKDGDVLTDPGLYKRLEAAEWTGNETELDGVKYRRMKAADAVSRAKDRPQHYAWDGEERWHYFQYEPIKWRVLSVDENVLTLMAVRQMDCAPYNVTAEDVFWENCTMRSFLNGYDADANQAGVSYSEDPGESFLGTAFSDEEKQAVLKQTVTNPDNYYFGTDCGNDTEDYVYIPDEEEVFSAETAGRYGFVQSDGIGDPARQFQPTMYAMARGAWYSPVKDNQGNGFWLLRTAGYTPSNVNYICDYGYVYNRGTFVTCNDSGIVPMIRVDTDKFMPKDAGTICSDGTVMEDAGSEEEVSGMDVAAEQPELSEPVTEPDETASTGLATVWDCVYFGAYPSCEVLMKSPSAVEDYALEEGDIMVAPELFERLAAAEWTEDETELDGIKYRRMKAEDAITWAADRPQHYRWDGKDSWHYFRYEPIKWRVIELNGTEAMLVADEELDCAPYNVEAADVSWETCTLRSFLNGYDGSCNSAGIRYDERPQDSFYGSAFTEEEKNCIVCEAIRNPDNSNYRTDCGGETVDRVFILSAEEVYASDAASRHGFYQGNGVDDPAKRFDPTMYAMARGTWYSPVEEYQGNGFWFMRTNGYTPANVSYICDFGYIYERGTDVTCNDSGILPVIRVDLTLADLEEAGTVSSR